MKKRNILFGSVVILLIIIMILSIKLSESFDSKISDGIYKIFNVEEYPDAIIIFMLILKARI